MNTATRTMASHRQLARRQRRLLFWSKVCAAVGSTLVAASVMGMAALHL